MSKRALIWIGAVAVIIIAGVVIYYSTSGVPVPGYGANGGTWANGTSTVPNAATVATSTTAAPLPSGGAGIAVPQQNATTVPAGVAAPVIVASGSPSGLTSYRSFNVTETSRAFTPATIIVNQGDTVHINLTAQGGAYDFTQPDMGLSLRLSAGQTKVVQFDADTSGRFMFFCASCGGPSKGPVGYIEVVAK